MKTLLLLFAILVLMSGTSHANNIKDCELKSETVGVIVQGYHQGTDKSKLLLVYQGSDAWSVMVRQMIHSIYRGSADNLTPEMAREIVYDICVAEK